MGMIQRFRDDAWRWLFVAGALLIMIGGPQHPGGTMVEMLADPAWVRAHTLMLAGFIVLLLGVIRFRRTANLAPTTATWAKWAMMATAFQSLEMVLHTVSYVDQAHLAAGMSTPVLSTHLALAVIAYPLFAIAWIGLILTAARSGDLGARAIGWIGIVGLLGHGAAAPLTVVAQVPWAPALFPLVMLFGIWLVLAACWPARSTRP